ncbi:hypothetical protein PB2503_06792 [Parvularcula bermudensis HTCC2503]|uniref:Uncharacterized protein n=1 Tax=Parvularcula bermudensis (strain ATCC BAA-594 / HTCC2503 / KCTC 12087) TaxID=314260 RepID=E0TI85_PARBH|nr:hypothetical protein [Parvularcula bermudensis]ADM09424.1 hypothetical protein PB2503_06792 [Parvularcula bermudensis HTCC2503]
MLDSSGRFGKITIKLYRYGLAAIGPVGAAATQFYLLLVLLRLLSKDEFGSFSFLILSSQFCFGIWSALFCAPLVVMMNQETQEIATERVRSILGANIVLSIGVAVLFFGLGMWLSIGTDAALLFGLFAGTVVVRWVARAHAYAAGKQIRTALSDGVYALTLFVGTTVIFVQQIDSIVWASGMLLASVIAGYIPFGTAYWRQQIGAVRPKAVLSYHAVWKKHAGWSLLGVITTEATSNSHAYIVTALYGPAAFAPIAAAALIIRPIMVIVKALSEFERAQMAKTIVQRNFSALRQSLWMFRGMLLLVWIGSVGLAFLLFAFFPALVFPAEYDLRTLQIVATLWLSIAAVRIVRVPDNIFLQSSGYFKMLAFASIFSSGVSLFLVPVLTVLNGPVWSVVGILGGEVVFAAAIIQRALKRRATMRQEVQDSASDPGVMTAAQATKIE